MVEGQKEDVFTLDEGDAVIQWPKNMSKASFEDFESWLQLVIRKAKRSVGNLRPMSDAVAAAEKRARLLERDEGSDGPH